MISKLISMLFLSVLICSTSALAVNEAVKKATDPAIKEHRTGTLTVITKPGAKVSVRQIRHEFLFGTAISGQMFSDANSFRGKATESDKAKYKSVLVENFNAAVHENALKWYSTEKNAPGNPDYSMSDIMLDFCEQNGIALRGHCIYWGIEELVQVWVKSLDDVTLRRTLARRGMEVTSRYRGRIADYDLNNEMLHGDFFRDRLGDSITKEMFNWAKAGDPDAILYVNDFSVLSGLDLDAYIDQIKEFKRRGIPVGGIGVQGHFIKELDIAQIKAALDKLAQFGLPIKVTEYDLDLEDEDIKADAIDAFYRTCFAHPTVESVMMWGFWEGSHWRPKAALWKRDWTATKAAKAYRNLLFNEWWTKFEGTADDNGICKVPAFFGTYLITSGESEITVDFTRKEGCKTIYLGL